MRVTDAAHGDSGDSTDSLIDEAEDYVRRSIDSIITRTDVSHFGKRRMGRRHSDPDPGRGKFWILNLDLLVLDDKCAFFFFLVGKLETYICVIQL